MRNQRHQQKGKGGFRLSNEFTTAMSMKRLPSHKVLDDEYEQVRYLEHR